MSSYYSFFPNTYYNWWLGSDCGPYGQPSISFVAANANIKQKIKGSLSV